MTIEEQLAEVKYALDSMVHAHAEQRAALQERDRQYWELKNRSAILANGILQIRELVNESEGVAGYHLNGDVATWDSLNLDDFNSAIVAAVLES